MKGQWIGHEVRDEVVDFVRDWSERTELAAGDLAGWMGLKSSKYYDWRSRYGRANEHNAWVPRDHWLTEAEKAAIQGYWREHPL